MKVCSSCHKNLPLKNFYTNGGGRQGVRGDCKKCLKPRYREYYVKNKEKYWKQSVQWHKDNPRLLKNSKLKQAHGITIEDFDRMCLEQKNRCKICGTENFNNKSKGRLCVDHCHRTGKIRG